MSEQLVMISDRETLTRTLLEVQHLLSTESTRSSLRARVRVLWLLQTLCVSHLSPTQVSTISRVSVHLRDQLRHGFRERDQELVSMLPSILHP